MLRIPIETGGRAKAKLSTNLNGVSLAIRLLWNWTDGHWFADFETAEGKRHGVRVVAFSSLLDSSSAILPEGGLVVIRERLDGCTALGFGNLGTEWGLYYCTESELSELRDGGFA